MKKLFLAATAAAVLLFHSCNKETFHHSMALVYPTSYQPAVIFADQTSDSLWFQTTDNFNLSAYESPWIHIPDSMRSGKIPNAYRVVYDVVVPLTFDANTTEKVRTGYVSVRSFGSNDWDNTAYAAYYQTSWHNITRPLPVYSYEDRVITGAAFRDSLTAQQTVDTLVFQAYDNWTLTGGQFVRAEYTKGFAGECRVPLTIEPNTGDDTRKDVLVLESDNGVRTPITYIQKVKPQPEESNEDK